MTNVKKKMNTTDVMRHFEDPRAMGSAQRLSLHSSNYGVVVGWRSYNPCSTCIH